MPTPKVKVKIKKAGKKSANEGGYLAYGVRESHIKDHNKVTLPLTSGSSVRVIKTGATVTYRLVEFFAARIGDAPTIPDKTPKRNEEILAEMISPLSPIIDSERENVIHSIYGYYVFARTEEERESVDIDGPLPVFISR